MLLTKKLNRIILFLFLFLIVFFMFYNSFYFLQIYSYFISTENNDRTILHDGELLRLKSKCSCKDTSIHVLKNGDRVFVTTGSGKEMYNFSDSKYDTGKISCDLYNVFSRGPKQKVIGYSLYGTDRFYYDSIRNISKLAKKYYPDWTLRIYHDFSINDTVVCELECLKENNIDFCNVNSIPAGSNNDYWSALHMHKMTWRWIPIGDSFVDLFMSRDTDSWINEREYDSVQVWLKSKTVFHIMRGILSLSKI